MTRWLPFLVTASLVGCSDASKDAREYSSLPPATLTRVIQVGDRWVWDAEETTSDPGDRTKTSVKGTKSVSAVRASLEGEQHIALSGTIEQFATDGGKQVYNWTEYISQNPNRDVISHGDTEGENGALRKLAVATLIWPGTWSPTTTITTEAKYDTGFTYIHEIVVKGTEEVETSIARLTCWKGECETRVVYQEMEVVADEHRTFWFAPQLGAVVKECWTSSEKYGNEREGTFLLRSTTVPLE